MKALSLMTAVLFMAGVASAENHEATPTTMAAPSMSAPAEAAPAATKADAKKAKKHAKKGHKGEETH